MNEVREAYAEVVHRDDDEVLTKTGIPVMPNTPDTIEIEDTKYKIIDMSIVAEDDFHVRVYVGDFNETYEGPQL